MKSANWMVLSLTLVVGLFPAILLAQESTTVKPAQPPGTIVPPAELLLQVPVANEPGQTTQPPAAQQPPQRPVQPPGTAPQNTPNTVQSDAAAFARANEAVASAPRSLTPGVFGDQFGGNSLKLFRSIGQEGQPQIFDNLHLTPPSSLVGRFKVAENNSPIPGDRVYLNYNFFSSTIYGVDVSRFTPGVEKSFFDGMASVELRLPFASTLDEQHIDAFSGFGATNGIGNRLGNLQIVTKLVLAQSDTWLIGGGVGVSVPTADDLDITTGNGATFIQVGNEAVYLQPFLSFLYAPCERLYFQGFSGIDIDLNGNPVRFVPGANDLNEAGRLRDRTFWTTDIAIGYWIYRNECESLITGIAPQFEVHWNQALDKVSTVSNNIGGILGDSHLYSNVNLGAILNIEIRNSSRLALGAVMPVTGNGNKDFDVEFGVLFNYYF